MYFNSFIRFCLCHGTSVPGDGNRGGVVEACLHGSIVRCVCQEVAWAVVFSTVFRPFVVVCSLTGWTQLQVRVFNRLFLGSLRLFKSRFIHVQKGIQAA